MSGCFYSKKKLPKNSSSGGDTLTDVGKSQWVPATSTHSPKFKLRYYGRLLPCSPSSTLQLPFYLVPLYRRLVCALRKKLLSNRGTSTLQLSSSLYILKYMYGDTYPNGTDENMVCALFVFHTDVCFDRGFLNPKCQIREYRCVLYVSYFSTYCWASNRRWHYADPSESYQVLVLLLSTYGTHMLYYCLVQSILLEPGIIQWENEEISSFHGLQNAL